MKLTHLPPKLTMALAVCTLLALAVPPAFAAGGSSVPPPSPTAPTPLTPEQEAAQLYNDGLAARDKAWKLEEKASNATSEHEKAKLHEKMEESFEKAVKKQSRAVELNPSMHQAHSSLGYALRRLGRYPEALKAYDQALKLNPSYSEAIEYRAEAYLGLNRLDDAKQAYIVLFKSDRARADELMHAMGKWLEAKRENPAGLDETEVDAFAVWLESREEMAEQTAQLSGGGRIW
jgi:tetratricopeptide (TPR) repeat protein